MATLKEEQISQAFARPVENLTSPFKPIRRLVAAATDILRRKHNVFLIGGLDPSVLNPRIENPELNTLEAHTADEREGVQATIPNPDFDPQKVMELTRPIAEIIILLTCEEDMIIAALDDVKILDKEVSRLLISHTDTEVIEQLPAVMEAIQSITASSVEVDSDGDDISLDPEKKP